MTAVKRMLCTAWRITLHVCSVPYSILYMMKYRLSRSRFLSCKYVRIRLPIFCLSLPRPLLNLSNMLIAVSDSDLSMV